MNDILKRKFWGYGSSVFLCSFNVDLTLGQAHRPWDFGDIVGSLIEKNRHSEKEYKRDIRRSVVVTVPQEKYQNSKY